MTMRYTVIVLITASLVFAGIKGLDLFQSSKQMNILKYDYGEINEVYGEYFKVDPPAREAMHVSGLPLNVDVEISCIAIEN